MRKNSFLLKNFFAYTLLVLFAFAITILVFYQQVGGYAAAVKQEELCAIAGGVAGQTALLTSLPAVERVGQMDALYRQQLIDTVQQYGIAIALVNPQGEVTLVVHPSGRMHMPQALSIPPATLEQLYRTDEYLPLYASGIFAAQARYAVVKGVRDTQDRLIAAVAVAAEDDRLAIGMQRSSQTLMLILLSIMLIVLLLSFLVSRYMTRPLKAMVGAVKEFAEGNFEVRVPEDNGIEEIDELAASFNNMARDLNQLEELTRGFISNVSHEFKTPMTTIGGFVDGMIDGTIPPDRYDHYLGIISEETHRLSRMVGRMLDAAKIQSGELLLSMAPLDFSEMVSRIILSFEQKIEQRGLAVDCALDDRLMVPGDADHLYRALYNLVDNAVKFSQPGGMVRLQARAEGTLCYFSVTNTGAGIAEDELPHVFDRFYKADKSRSLDKTGAGLGLYIVKNIIHLHGGEISVRSDGEETEFSLTLPRLAPSAHMGREGTESK